MGTEKKESILDRLPVETQEFLREIQAENNERFEQTGKLSYLFGLQTIGGTEESVRYALSLGEQLIRQGDLEKADVFFRGMIGLEPFRPQVYFNLGVIQHKQKHYAEAVLLYATAELYSTEGDDLGLIRLYTAECQLHLGKIKEGLETLEKAIDLLAKRADRRGFLERAEQVRKIQSESQPKST